MKELNKFKKIELIEYIEKLKNDIQDLNIKYKYAKFDSEASNREVEYLKKILKDKDK